MGWRFWQKDDEVAGPAEEDDWRDVDVVVLDRPASTAPGAPLPCRNDGDPVRVGEQVALATTFTHQPATIRAIRVAGVESDELGSEQLGDVVLGDEVDLTQVFRGSSLVVDEEGDWPEGSLVVQVQRAEQRGEDALVVVRVAFGTARPGLRLVTSHDDDRLPPLLEVASVESPRGPRRSGWSCGRCRPTASGSATSSPTSSCPSGGSAPATPGGRPAPRRRRRRSR